MNQSYSNKEVYFQITLKQPLIISAQSATVGNHQCLDYIPGSVLLGLAASRLYTSLTPNEAWILFHSGFIKFGDALPSFNNEYIGFPMPFSLHSFKGETYYKRIAINEHCNQLLEDSLFDPSLAEKVASGESVSQNKQPVQMRGGYVAPNGVHIQIKQEHTLKTAIDAATAKAAEGQLFGYEAMSSGQVFCCKIICSSPDHEKLFERLITSLEGSAQLGRSRSAQFGQVEITKLNQKTKNWMTSPASNQVTLWLLSDLAIEKNGMPCLQPDPELFGFPEGTQFNIDKSFLRARRYSSYNAYRRSYDTERQVISRGSILRFSLPSLLSETLTNRLGTGIGLYQESGLGQVLVNPNWLSAYRPKFDFELTNLDQNQRSSVIQKQVAKPQSKLIGILETRLKADKVEQEIRQEARRLFEGLCDKIGEVRAYKAMPAYIKLSEAPSSTQWGNIKEIASNLRQDNQALFQQLFDPNNGVIRNRSGWELEYGPNAYLYEWMQESLIKFKNNTFFSEIVANLAVLGLTDEWIRCCEGRNKQFKVEESIND